MRYLSLDTETTGLKVDSLVIQLGFVPVDATSKKILHHLGREYLIKCPSFEELEPSLNDFVKRHNKDLIEQAHKEGLSLLEVKEELRSYLELPQLIEFFEGRPAHMMGKSISSLDWPYLCRDFGWDFMRSAFSHRVLDVGSFAMGLIDSGRLPKHQGLESTAELMKYFGLGQDADHKALKDAEAVAEMYFHLTALK